MKALASFLFCLALAPWAFVVLCAPMAWILFDLVILPANMRDPAMMFVWGPAFSVWTIVFVHVSASIE